MEDPTTYQKEVMEKIDQQHTLLREKLASLTHQNRVKSGAKDVMAHLTAWEARMFREINAIVAERPRPDELKMGEFNDQVYEANKDRPYSTIHQEFEESFAKTRQFVADLPAHAFSIRLVKSLIGFNTHGHYRWAIERIESRLLADT